MPESISDPVSEPIHAYLTVISWPGGWGEPERVDALVEGAGMDLYQARLAARRNTPGIMRVVDAGMRGHVVAALQNRGVLCLAPTHGEVAGYPVAEVARGVEQFPDADPARFVTSTMRGQSWTFTAEQVRLIVWGRLKASSVTIHENRLPRITTTMHPEIAIGHVLAGDGAYSSKRIRVQEIIDLHVDTESGLRLLRLIGARTRVGIVGDDGRPPLPDGTRPLELMEALMPDARVDRAFHDFDPPHTLRKASRKAGHGASDMTMGYWSFYSPWVGLMDQALYG